MQALSKIQSFYNKIAPFYFMIDFLLKFPRPKIKNIIYNLPSGILLDIGVGSGYYLDNYTKHQIFGIDISEKMIHKAQLKNPQHHFFTAAAHELPFENNFFDYIVLTHVLTVVPNVEQVFSEIYRCLKPHGKIIICHHVSNINISVINRMIFSVLKYNYFTNIESSIKMNQFKLISLQHYNLPYAYKIWIFEKRFA